MKILDVKKKGNTVSFFLGDSELTSWSQPTWLKPPYHKSSLVEASKVKRIVTIVFNFSLLVLQPHEQIFGTYISKQELVDKQYPLVILHDNITQQEHRIYMGDEFDSIPISLIFTQYEGIF